MKPRSILAATALLLFSALSLHAIVPTNFPSFKPFLGLAYSPFQGNESPDFNTYPPVAGITYDLTNSVTFLASEIALYGMDGTLSNIPALCNTYGIKCYPCAFLSTNNLTDNTNELNALIAVGNQNFPTTRGLIVGTESLLYDYDPATLISQINYVRAATHTNVPVGTRDIAGSFFGNPDVVQACDFIQADIHPYWAQMPGSEGVSYTISQWQALTNRFPDVRVEIGETGWPTGGTNIDWSNPSVVPSVANQGSFAPEFVPVANRMGIEYFIFDFRDEAWKTQEGNGTVDTNWGVLYGDSTKKQSLIDFLSAGFTENIISANPTNATISLPTFETDPYQIYSTTNLITGPWYFVSSFSATAGTNQTVVTVPNPYDSRSWFYRALQGF